MSRKMLRIFVVLALATLTFAGSAQAAGLGTRSLEPTGLAAVWESIAGWLRTVQGLPSAMWGNEGSQMDPNGTNTSMHVNEPTDPDAGSQMDPNGL